MVNNREEKKDIVINDKILLLVRGNIENVEERKEYIKRLGNAIIQCFNKHGKVNLRYVGAGAGNNADKALIIAYDKGIEYEYVFAYMPDFTVVTFNDKNKTGIIKEVINIIDLYPKGFYHDIDKKTLLLVRGIMQNRYENSEYIKKLANAILQVYYKHKKVNLRYVGAGAGNNADKALIIARGEAFKNGDILACVPAFTEVEFEGTKKTGIVKGIINIKELY